MKKIGKYILVILICGLFLFAVKLPTKADSGWDSSYDSGGSDWGGSDWDSGGSWDNDWGSSGENYSGTYSSIEFGGFELLIVIIFIIIIVGSYMSQKRKMTNSKKPKTIINYQTYDDITEEEFTSVIKDNSIDSLKDKVFDIYKDIQYAWTNFDYKKLRNLTTDEIYNMYFSQLTALEVKNQVNIMSEIDKKDVKIISVKEENSIITVDAYLKVTCYDYIINKNTNKLLRGVNDSKLEIEYIITLVKDVNSKNNNIVNCPNCGAEVDVNASGRCQYCDAVLVQKPNDYVMSKKQCIGQRTL